MEIEKIYVPARNFEGQIGLSNIHIPEELQDAYFPIYVRKSLVAGFCASPKWQAKTEAQLIADDYEDFIGLTD